MAQTIQLTDGQQCHALTAGRGRPLLFIHGLPGQGSDFLALATRLAIHHQCILLDRPGYGQSTLKYASRTMSVERAAQDVSDILEQLDLQNVVLVGWSYGGHIVAEVCGLSPARVTATVLIGSAGPSLRWPINILDRMLFHSGLGNQALNFVKRRVPGVIVNELNAAIGQKAPQPLIDEFLAHLNRPDMISNWLREAAVWQPSTMQPQSIAQPCLILHGKDDTRIPIEVAYDTAGEIAHARFIEIAEAGHWPFLTHTQEVEEAMVSFLSSTQG